MTNENPTEGGSYSLDPETGERTLIKRTASSTQNEETVNGTSGQKKSNSAGTGKQLRNRYNTNRGRRSTSK